jgi:hypothetical protein
VITDAYPGRSRDLRQRQTRYLITMGFRILCFLAVIVVPDTGARLALIVAAGVLPGIAVLAANAVDRRSHDSKAIERGEPEQRRALPRQATVAGDIAEDPDQRA